MIIIENVRCEYLLNPIGIDVEEPRITWNLSTDYFDSEDIYQKNFQIYYSINRGDDTLDKTSGVIESRSMNYIFKNEFKSRDLIRLVFWIKNCLRPSGLEAIIVPIILKIKGFLQTFFVKLLLYRSMI